MRSQFAIYKAKILQLTNNNIINLQVAKDKAKIKMICTVEDCNKVLDILKPKRKKKLQQATDQHNWKHRYEEAHKLNFQREYPGAWKDGHYFPVKSTDYPDVTTHGGLITFMVNYIRWVGGNATPFNVVTRVSDKEVTEASGNKFTDKRYTKSSRKGLADVQGGIAGKKLQLDAKVGRDTPRKDQLLEQQRERKAGCIYEFIHGTDEFFDVFDQVMYG